MINFDFYTPTKILFGAGREREVILRKLDVAKIDRERTFWQLINVAAPVLCVLVFALLFGLFRKKYYTGKLFSNIKTKKVGK